MSLTLLKGLVLLALGLWPLLSFAEWTAYVDVIVGTMVMDA